MFFKRRPQKAIQEDDELLSLYKASGDIALLGTLYERYVHLVFGVCMKYLKNEDDSKDMCMQIFEKLVENVRSSNVRNFKSWVHVLTKNECLMLLRSRKYKLQKTAVEINDDKDMNMAYTLHHTEDALEIKLQELEVSIEELPPEQRACIHMFYLEQQSYKTIAALTGHDIKKVKSYIQNGKRNLKISLEKPDAES